ncbi:unnamed protein product [Linum trigynum]|uniref:Uncharacterized protein n=2 Tax=Linum trigynum TaxID=586398 RepID=A0AAV2CU02_9ROSI
MRDFPRKMTVHSHSKLQFNPMILLSYLVMQGQFRDYFFSGPAVVLTNQILPKSHYYKRGQFQSNGDKEPRFESKIREWVPKSVVSFRAPSSRSVVSSPALRRFVRQNPRPGNARPGATLAFSGFHMTRDEAGAVDFGSVVGDGFGFAGVVQGFFFEGENRTGRLGGRE